MRWGLTALMRALVAALAQEGIGKWGYVQLEANSVVGLGALVARADDGARRCQPKAEYQTMGSTWMICKRFSEQLMAALG